VTCAEFIEFLLEYDEGRLPPDVRARFDEHLAICPDCVNYLASYRATIALGKIAFADPAASLPDTVPEELVQAILGLRNSVDGTTN
jgi:anti-sigma factor RsiW